MIKWLAAAFFIALAVVFPPCGLTDSSEFPDEIMGVDLMQALDETISDIDTAFEALKSSEEGIEIQLDELQKKIDSDAQEIAKKMRPGRRYSKVDIYELIGDNANIVQLQEKAIKLYKEMLYKRISTVTEVMDLNSRLGELLKHKEVLDDQGNLDKEAMYRHQDGMLNFAKAFAGLEDLVNGDFFDEVAAVDPNLEQRRETIKHSWDLFQSQLEDFFQIDDETVDTEWLVDYYREIQNNIDATLNEAYLMLDESLAWEDRLKQRGLTVALELLSAKLSKAHQRMGGLRRPPKVKMLPRISGIISSGQKPAAAASMGSMENSGESWRERIERIDQQVKNRRKGREGK